MTIQSTLKIHSLVEKVEVLQVPFTLCLRDQWSKWMHDGCKVYMDSYMATNESCFIIPWIIFKNCLLDMGLTQIWETIALWNLTNIDFLSFIMCEDTTWIKIRWNGIWLRAWSHLPSHYTPVTRLHHFGSDLGSRLDTSFGLPQLHG